MEQTLLVRYLCIDARLRLGVGEVVARHQPRLRDRWLHGDHPYLVDQAEPVGFHQYSRFQHDVRLGVAPLDVGDFLRREALNLRPNDVCQLLHQRGVTKDLAAQQLPIDRAVRRHEVVPEPVDHRLEAGTARLVHAVAEPVRVDDDGTKVAKPASRRRLTGRDPTSETNNGHELPPAHSGSERRTIVFAGLWGRKAEGRE